VKNAEGQGRFMRITFPHTPKLEIAEIMAVEFFKTVTAGALVVR
jgi:hypothetical protein